MSTPEFAWVMVQYFWPLVIIALPGIYLISRDLVKGAIHLKKKTNTVEVVLRATPERKPDELSLAKI